MTRTKETATSSSGAIVLKEQEQHAALTRLFDYYVHTATAAMDTLLPAEAGRCRRLPRWASSAGLVADPAAARAWLDGLRTSLVAVTAYTAANGWPVHATRLSATLARYLENGGHFPVAITVPRAGPQCPSYGLPRRVGVRACR
jgi:hypothetical protein